MQRQVEEVFNYDQDLAEINKIVNRKDIRPRIELAINGRTVTGLIDTGASISVIPRALAKEIIYTYTNARAANGTAIDLLGVSEVHIRGRDIDHTVIFRVVEELPQHDAILGADIIKIVELDLNYHFYKNFPKKDPSYKLPLTHTLPVAEISVIDEVYPIDTFMTHTPRRSHNAVTQITTTKLAEQFPLFSFERVSMDEIPVGGGRNSSCFWRIQSRPPPRRSNFRDSAR